MKIILHAGEATSKTELIEMACAAAHALSRDFSKTPPGTIWGIIPHDSNGGVHSVIRRKGCITVYPPGGSSDADR